MFSNENLFQAHLHESVPSPKFEHDYFWLIHEIQKALKNGAGDHLMRRSAVQLDVEYETATNKHRPAH